MRRMEQQLKLKAEAEERAERERREAEEAAQRKRRQEEWVSYNTDFGIMKQKKATSQCTTILFVFVI